MPMLVPLKTADEIRKSSENNYEEWGAPTLTLQQYLNREACLGQTLFSQFGNSAWALVADASQSDEVCESTLDFLSHCELFKHQAAIVDSDGKLHKGVCHSIATVFTPRPHRRQGHAAEMLTKVLEAVVRRDPTAIASALYSDIGSDYYDRLGWKCHRSQSAVLSTSPATNASNRHQSHKTTAIEMLQIGDDRLKNLLSQDAAQLCADLVNSQPETRLENAENKIVSKQPLFAILPTWEPIDWLFTRGCFYARVTRTPPVYPAHCGVAIPHSDDYVVWMHNIKENSLDVLRCRITQEKHVAPLLDACLDEAVMYNLPVVKIWEPSALVANAKGFDVDLIDRKDSLASLNVIKHKKPGETVLWKQIEKYVWV